MIVESESSIVGEYFNEKWQLRLMREIGVSLETTVFSIWVVDTPVSGYQFKASRIMPDQFGNGFQKSVQYTDYAVTIDWHWFAIEDGSLSKIRLDYHLNEDILYIVNQHHRRPALSIFDVINPHTIV
jgi:hypothetical protein